MPNDQASPLAATLRRLAETRRRRRMGQVAVIDTSVTPTDLYCTTATSPPPPAGGWTAGAQGLLGPCQAALGYTPVVGDQVWVWVWPPQLLVLGIRSTA